MSFDRISDWTTPAIEEGVWTRNTTGLTIPVYNAHTESLPFRFVKFQDNTNLQESGNTVGVVPITADEPDLIAGILMRPSAHKDSQYSTINNANVNWQTASGFSAVPVKYVSSLAVNGFLNVYFEQDCSMDDPLFMRFAPSGSNTELARVRADDNAGTCLAIPRGKVTLTRPAKAGTFSEVRLNF